MTVQFHKNYYLFMYVFTLGSMILVDYKKMDRSSNSTKLHSTLFIYHINIQNVSSSRLAVKCKRTLNQLVTTTTTTIAE